MSPVKALGSLDVSPDPPQCSTIGCGSNRLEAILDHAMAMLQLVQRHVHFVLLL